MRREIIDLKNITFETVKELTNYVWTKGKLIPQEYFDSNK